MHSYFRKSAVLSGAVLLCAAVSAFGSEADALAISANIQAKHMPFGTILDPMFPSSASTQIVGYTRCGDSAIWTGHYLAAESFRYAVTHSPDAFSNLTKAIAGLKSLADVTGTNLLARCLVSQNSPYAAGIASEENANGVYTNASAGYIWIGNTTRDQFVGAIFGLSVAYDLVDDAATRNNVRQLMTRLVSFLSGHNWGIRLPTGDSPNTFLLRPDELLMIMKAGQHVNPDTHSAADALLEATITPGIVVPVSFDTLSTSSYFKFNLDYVTLYNLIRVQGPISASSSAYSVLRDYTSAHQNAFFNVIDRAINGPNAARDAETLNLLNEWLLRSPRDQYVDNTSLVKVCGNAACAPIPVPMRTPTDFLWQRDPFQLAGGGAGRIENAGIDYILPYWMSRYYGLTTPMVAQSAAAPSPAVAPNSLGSLYGSNLASMTIQAQSQPLPLDLGGASLSLTDSAGTSWQTPLLYVSPGQINFLTPAGAAAGSGTLSLTNSTGQVSAPVVIWPVVPRLFTMSTSGLAAATAVEVPTADPKNQTTIPVFSCSGSVCSAVPLTLPTDGTVYLTLYGTGIRNRAALSAVTVTVNGITAPVSYAGPQSEFAGLDQVNIALPQSLAGAGTVPVVLTLAGQTSNAVIITIH